MAINFTYPPKPIPVGGDRLLIIDVEDIENPLSTKEINIQNIVDLSPQGTVTSVGISTIPAFSVTGSPVTESGVIAIGVQGGSEGQFLDSTGNWSTPIIPDEFNLTVTDGSTTESHINTIRVAGGVVTGNGAGLATITIQAGSSVTVAPNTGLAIDGSDVMSTIYNTTIGDAVQSIAVGGADPAPASEWKTKTIVQALDTILFPTILASISTPKAISLSVSGGGGIVEVGTTVARTLTATFNDGQIENGDGTTGPDLVGAATQYTFTGTGISSTPQVGNTLAISNTVVSGSNNWAVSVDHDAGTGAYYDNKGVAGTNLYEFRVAGSITASSPTITGRYKQFYGVTDTTPTTSTEVRAFSSNFTNTNTFVTPTFSDIKFVIAIPATRNLVSVITSNNENITANFVLNTFNVNDADGTPVSYKVYTFTSVTPLNVTATVTLSGS